MISELQRFVREALLQGETRDRIHQALRSGGWPEDEIQDALASYAPVDFPVPVPRRKPYVSAREAFLYLLLFLTLYMSAFHAGSIWFAWVDAHLRDPLLRDVDPRSRAEGVRTSVAMLLIAFPVYLGLARMLRRAIAISPENRASRVRKWLTYLTLFLAAGTLLGDLSALVMGLLRGDLSGPFLAKVAVVFVLAGTAFGFYLWDLRLEESESSAAPDTLAHRAGLAVAVAAAITLGLGLAQVGRPGVERLVRLDQQRTEDLAALRETVRHYHEVTGRLPEALAVLTTATPRFSRTIAAQQLEDPVTRQPYRYEIRDSVHFALAAEFQTERLPGPGMPGEFAHRKGSQWFEFPVLDEPRKVAR